MKKEPDEVQLGGWRAFLNAHAAVIEAIEREMAEAGQIPLSSYDVLLALKEAPGQRLRMHEIASTIVLSRSGLTRRIDRLEAEGLLVRERSGADRRGAYAVLTPAGLEALRRAWPVYAQGISKYFATQLSDAEAQTLAELLGRVLLATRERKHV